ncbi:hypothetical protein CPLU01_06578 [Colletotrichum plurivorum]|uniref:Xylanolytic transcriptional activator regulatory domain-containing protein n=1 Tax=Colletotrichum plurivorum TaxID=2175906 RepID=A0A8H6KIW9_9PEZI|nr:hypothetical protein CPLU01_06578 [Colletotrichum plurivorum]
MQRPVCAACDTHDWTCSYTIARKRPGPRRGSKQVKTVEVQRRLDRIERLLQSQGASGDVALSASPAPGSRLGEQEDLEQRRRSEATETSSIADVESELAGQCKPFIDALRWTDAKNTSSDAASSFIQPPTLPNLAPTASQSPLSSDMEVHLLSLYFSRLTLPLPVFFEDKFYCDYNAGRVPGFLLDAMFSLSSRFSTESEVLAFGNDSQILAAQHFATKASRELGKVAERSSAASIAEVKASYLLMCHAFTQIPSRTAAEHCSGAVRAAYRCRLHQLDNPKAASSIGHLSDAEKEEVRCLWWGIFMFDTFSSMLSQIPSSIEDCSIAVFLPSVVITHSATSHQLPLSKVYLEDTLEDIWKLGGNNESHGAKVQAVLIYVVALSREITTVQRLWDENPRCHLETRLVHIREKWASLFRTLPPWFFSPDRHRFDRTAEEHCKRLEALNMINILDGAATPNDGGDQLPGRWKTCVSYALKVAATHRVWTAEGLDRADPMMLPITRMAACLLIFELMNSSPVLAAEKLVVLDSVDLLMSSLDHSSRLWGISSALLRSVEELRGQSWKKLSLKAIFQLLLTISTPQKQYLGVQRTEPPVLTSNSLGVPTEVYPDEDTAMNLVDWSFEPMWLPPAEPPFMDGWLHQSQ